MGLEPGLGVGLGSGSGKARAFVEGPIHIGQHVVSQPTGEERHPAEAYVEEAHVTSQDTWVRVGVRGRSRGRGRVVVEEGGRKGVVGESPSPNDPNP